MQVFNTDRRLHLTNELKSWVLTAALALLLYFGFTLFSSIPPASLIAALVVVFLAKLGNTLTQYHVKTIQLDNEKDKLDIILSSIMSGKKNKTYDLRQVTSELIENKTLINGFKSSPTLKIYVTKKETFVISNRFGFTKDTLNTVDNAIRLSNNPIKTK